MPSKYTSGKKDIAECDRCGFRYLLKELKKLTIKTKNVNILVCPTCWEPDHPQLQLGMYPVNDPQALRNPRRDTTYVTSGVNSAGNLSGGSRDIQWGWSPVGGASFNDAGLTPNYLVATTFVGTVTIS
jgi:DNA-directed RNA polymerase subunit RPC12/RpoP